MIDLIEEPVAKIMVGRKIMLPGHSHTYVAGTVQRM